MEQLKFAYGRRLNIDESCDPFTSKKFSRVFARKTFYHEIVTTIVNIVKR